MATGSLQSVFSDFQGRCSKFQQDFGQQSKVIRCCIVRLVCQLRGALMKPGLLGAKPCLWPQCLPSVRVAHRCVTPWYPTRPKRTSLQHLGSKRGALSHSPGTVHFNKKHIGDQQETSQTETKTNRDNAQLNILCFSSDGPLPFLSSMKLVRSSKWSKLVGAGGRQELQSINQTPPQHSHKITFITLTTPHNAFQHGHRSRIFARTRPNYLQLATTLKQLVDLTRALISVTHSKECICFLVVLTPEILSFFLPTGLLLLDQLPDPPPPTWASYRWPQEFLFLMHCTLGRRVKFKIERKILTTPLCTNTQSKPLTKSSLFLGVCNQDTGAQLGPVLHKQWSSICDHCLLISHAKTSASFTGIYMALILSGMFFFLSLSLFRVSICWTWTNAISRVLTPIVSYYWAGFLCLSSFFLWSLFWTLRSLFNIHIWTFLVTISCMSFMPGCEDRTRKCVNPAPPTPLGVSSNPMRSTFGQNSLYEQVGKNHVSTTNLPSAARLTFLRFPVGFWGHRIEIWRATDCPVCTRYIQTPTISLCCLHPPPLYTYTNTTTQKTSNSYDFWTNSLWEPNRRGDREAFYPRKPSEDHAQDEIFLTSTLSQRRGRAP